MGRQRMPLLAATETAKVVQLQGESQVAEASLEAAEKSLEIAKAQPGCSPGWSRRSMARSWVPWCRPGTSRSPTTPPWPRSSPRIPCTFISRSPSEHVLKLNRLRLEGEDQARAGQRAPGSKWACKTRPALPAGGSSSSLSGAVDPATGTARWRAKIPNPDELLLPGMFARVHLPIGTPHQALLVHERALFSSGPQYVKVVSEDGFGEESGRDEWGTSTTICGRSPRASRPPTGSSSAHPDWNRLLQYERSLVEVERVPMPTEASNEGQRLQ